MKYEGKNACREALKSGLTVDKLLVQNGIEDREIVNLAKEMGVKIQYVNKQVMDEQSETKKHQGLIVYTSDFKYSTVEEIIGETKNNGKDLLILILDGIEDPHNLGSILRVSECMGVSGVIISKRRAVQVNETVTKVSAGAVARVKVARVNNIHDTIEELKEKGVFIYSADMDGVDVSKTNLTGDIGLIIGSEGFGVSRLSRKLSDGIVSIPMFGEINSLNASVSAGMVVYEAVRQRNLRK